MDIGRRNKLLRAARNLPRGAHNLSPKNICGFFEKSIVDPNPDSEKTDFTLHDEDITKILDLESLLTETKIIAYL